VEYTIFSPGASESVMGFRTVFLKCYGNG
jgi:hypothetical protein